MTDRTSKQIVLTRRSPAYWRVTFDHPPLNIFGPETIPQLNEIITALEADEQVTPKDVMEGLSPMGRPSTVQAVTDAVLYLTDTTTVTGHILYVDGAPISAAGKGKTCSSRPPTGRSI
jgi:hypothetical protein